MSLPDDVDRRVPDPVAVADALDKWFEAGSEEMSTILELKQSLLLTDTADEMISLRIEHIEKSSDIDHHQYLLNALLQRLLLRRARVLGVASAWKEFENGID